METIIFLGIDEYHRISWNLFRILNTGYSGMLPKDVIVQIGGGPKTKDLIGSFGG